MTAQLPNGKVEENDEKIGLYNDGGAAFNFTGRLQFL